MEKIKFSILIPVYNTEKYIRQCLDSVENQQYESYEMIIVDDGTPDHAGQICDEYASRNPKIHVIHQKNQGIVSARDTAIAALTENSPSSVVMFLDSDDMMAPGALQRLNEIFSKENPDMVMFPSDDMLEDGTVMHTGMENFYEGTIQNKGELYSIVFGSFAYNGVDMKAVRSDRLPRDLYPDCYHISHGEDLLRSIAIYKNCRKVKFIREHLDYYRVNPNSITHSIDYTKFHVDTTVRKRVLDLLREEQVWDDREMEEYLGKRREQLRDTVCDIGENAPSYQVASRIFEEIRKDSYYQILLDNTDPDDSILHALKNGKMRKFYLKCRVKKCLRPMLKLIPGRR